MVKRCLEEGRLSANEVFVNMELLCVWADADGGGFRGKTNLISNDIVAVLQDSLEGVSRRHTRIFLRHLDQRCRDSLYYAAEVGDSLSAVCPGRALNVRCLRTAGGLKGALRVTKVIKTLLIKE